MRWNNANASLNDLFLQGAGAPATDPSKLWHETDSYNSGDTFFFFFFFTYVPQFGGKWLPPYLATHCIVTSPSPTSPDMTSWPPGGQLTD